MGMTNSLSAILSISMAMTVFGARTGRESYTTGENIPPGVAPRFRPIIEFGHEGGNLRPYRIGIDARGRVKILEGHPRLKAHSLPVGKVRELVELARDENFWKPSAADEADAEQALPDFGFVFVRLRVGSGRLPVIFHRGPQAGPVGRLYERLADLLLTGP